MPKLRIESKATSVAEEKKITREHTDKIAMDFVGVPRSTRILFLDLMNLIFLLSGKLQAFKIPDPLTGRRILIDETMLAKLYVIVEAVNDFLKLDGFSLVPTSRVMTDLDHYNLQANESHELETLDVKKTIIKLRNV